MDQSVHIAVAAGGSHFLNEIGEVLRETFEELGFQATLSHRIQEVPARWQIALAPHELFVLDPGQFPFGKDPESLYLAVTTEQPGSVFFEKALETLSPFDAIWDLNSLSRDLLGRFGFSNTLPFRLGYHSYWDWTDRLRVEEEVDVLFIGSLNERRRGILSRLESDLPGVRFEILTAEQGQPLSLDREDVYYEEKRARALLSAKICLNLHDGDLPFFEGHRIEGLFLSQRRFVVSEPVVGHQPLADGEHLVFAVPDEMASVIRHYLDHPEEAAEIAGRGYDFLRRHLPFRRILEQLIEETRFVATTPVDEGYREVLDCLSTPGGLRLDGLSPARPEGHSPQGPPQAEGDTTEPLCWWRYLKPGFYLHSLRKLAWAATSVFEMQAHMREMNRKLDRILADSGWRAGSPDRDTGIRSGLANLSEKLSQLQRIGSDTYSHVRTLPQEQFGGDSPPPLSSNPGASPTVSVVIPCYNYERFLGEALESVAAQDWKDFEIIVVNDCSPDDTNRVVFEFCRRRPEISLELIQNERNRGVSHSRNAGFEAARGEYVFPLDADNWLRPDCLGKMVGVMEEHDFAFVYSWREEVGLRNGIVEVPDFDYQRLLEGPYIDCMALIRKEAWKEAGGYKCLMDFYEEDYEFWVNIAKRGHRGKVIPEPLVAYRVHRQSKSNLDLELLPRSRELLRELHPEVLCS